MSPEEALTVAQSRFQVAYGAGAGLLDWEAILSALLSVFSQCPSPTPATVRSNSSGLMFRLRFRQQLAPVVPFFSIPSVITSVVNTLAESTDDEVGAFLTAQQQVSG